MAFRFSLESFYQLRKSIEHQQWLKLASASQAVTRARQRLVQLDEQFLAAQRVLRAELASANLVPALHLGIAAQENYRRTRHEALVALRDTETTRNRELQKYAEFRQKREILSSLRASREKIYRREAERRRQQAVDELHLIRTLHAGKDELELPTD